MDKTTEITIPDGLLAEFNSPEINDRKQVDEAGSAVSDFALDMAEKTANIFYEAFDETCKEKGYTGLGKVKSKDLSTLTMVSMKQAVPAHILQNSPHIALALTFSGILGVNLVDHIKAQKAKKESENKSTDNE